MEGRKGGKRKRGGKAGAQKMTPLIAQSANISGYGPGATIR
jgi:hypothetical protein